MRVAAALFGLGFLVAGCAAAQERLPTGGDKLYEAVSTQTIAVIDSRSHTVDRRLPLGVPSSDWKHLYSIVSTSLVDTDPLTGATLNALPLGGSYQLPAATAGGMPGGLSPNGRWLVVESSNGSATQMLVIDTAEFKVSDRVKLNGRFHFDAISNDGHRLYLIQYLNGKEYYVRLYDLVGSRLDENIVVDKSDGNQAMTGLRLSGVAAHDGSMLFSMYVRENESPFIHALSLSGPYAFCLDVPGSGYRQGTPAMQWSLAMSRDGSRLYAINGATGTLAEVNSSLQYAPQVLRTAQIEVATSGGIGAGAAVVSADGKALVTTGASGIVWVDTATLTVRMAALSEWRITSLALTPDGSSLYAVTETGQVAEVSMTTGAVTSRFDPAAGLPLAIMRVAAA